MYYAVSINWVKERGIAVKSLEMGGKDGRCFEHHSEVLAYLAVADRLTLPL